MKQPFRLPVAKIGDFIPEPGKAGNDRREFVAEGYKPAFQAAAFLKKSLGKKL